VVVLCSSHFSRPAILTRSMGANTCLQGIQLRILLTTILAIFIFPNFDVFVQFIRCLFHRFERVENGTPWWTWHCKKTYNYCQLNIDKHTHNSCDRRKNHECIVRLTLLGFVWWYETFKPNFCEERMDDYMLYKISMERRIASHEDATHHLKSFTWSFQGNAQHVFRNPKTGPMSKILVLLKVEFTQAKPVKLSIKNIKTTTAHFPILLCTVRPHWKNARDKSFICSCIA